GALVIWWFMPGPPGAPLTLALYDQVALADEPVKLVAAVQPVAPAEEAEDLAGCVIHFTEFQSGLQQKAETDRLGLARCETRFPAGDLPRAIAASYAGDKRRKRRGVQAQGRVFV